MQRARFVAFLSEMKDPRHLRGKGKQRLVRKAQTCGGVMFVKYLL